MKRNHVIVITIAAMLALWMYSKSGNASTAICEGVSSKQLPSGRICQVLTAENDVMVAWNGINLP